MNRFWKIPARVTPRARHASISSSAAATVCAIAFSTSTCRPAFAAATHVRQVQMVRGQHRDRVHRRARGQSLAALVHLGDVVPGRQGAGALGDDVGDGVHLDAGHGPHRGDVDLRRDAGADQTEPEGPRSAGHAAR